MTIRSRAERYRLMLAHKAAASALENSLKDEAAEEYERESVRVTWDLPGGGQVVASLRRDASTVVLPEAFMEWLSINYPHQVRRVCRLEAINPAWVSDVFLPSLVPLVSDEDEPDSPMAPRPGESVPAVDPAGGAVVPGVRWVKGGGLSSVAIRNTDKEAVKRMNLAAAAYAEGAGPMPGLESGGEHA